MMTWHSFATLLVAIVVMDRAVDLVPAHPGWFGCVFGVLILCIYFAAFNRGRKERA